MTLSAVDSSGNSITLLTRNSTGQVLAAPVLGSKVLLSFLFGQALSCLSWIRAVRFLR